mmetsp:Transcript_56593/g.132781  ORF Transcript_56593/g.132781 Transcript_56593/m.132781 type:complete len:203 (-) Transcript_56593:951-1559(-)
MSCKSSVDFLRKSTELMEEVAVPEDARARFSGLGAPSSACSSCASPDVPTESTLLLTSSSGTRRQRCVCAFASSISSLPTIVTVAPTGRKHSSKASRLCSAFGGCPPARTSTQYRKTKSCQWLGTVANVRMCISLPDCMPNKDTLVPLTSISTLGSSEQATRKSKHVEWKDTGTASRPFCTCCETAVLCITHSFSDNGALTT